MKRTTHFLGFAARIDGVMHPAAVFKFNGTDAYWWDCHHPSNGHTIIFEGASLPINKSVPLSQGKVFRGVREQHSGHHVNGRRHLAIEAAGRKKEHVTNRDSTPIPGIKTWEHLSSIDVPLIGPFFWEMDAKLWHAVKKPGILQTEDFDSAYGVTLHAYICRREAVGDLVRHWRKTCPRHWSVGDGQFRIVVLVEPLWLDAAKIPA
jgi:hypothetical protein